MVLVIAHFGDSFDTSHFGALVTDKYRLSRLFV